MVVGRFIKDRRRFLKVIGDKSKEMVLGGKERSICDAFEEGTRLYLRYMLDESGTYIEGCHRKGASLRKVSGAIRSVVNDMSCSLNLYGRGTVV